MRILQNDVANRHGPITIVAAISSKFDDVLYPTEVHIAHPERGLSVDSVVLTCLGVSGSRGDIQ